MIPLYPLQPPSALKYIESKEKRRYERSIHVKPSSVTTALSHTYGELWIKAEDAKSNKSNLKPQDTME